MFGYQESCGNEASIICDDVSLFVELFVYGLPFQKTYMRSDYKNHITFIATQIFDSPISELQICIYDDLKT